MVAVTRSFADKLAARLGADPDVVFRFLSQWQQYEGGGAKHNPLNTTQPHARSIEPWNNLGGGIGVQQYADEDAGVEATYQTLVNGRYNNLVAGLRSGKIDPAKVAPEIRTWGTHGFADALAAQAAGGASPGTSGGAGMNSELEEFKQAEREAWQRWREAAKGLDPMEARTLPEYTAYLYAQSDRQEYESSFGKAGAGGIDPAQQQFENAIALGDYELSSGKLAYDRWADKYERAMDTARGQIDDAIRRNEANMAMARERATTPTPELGPFPEPTTYRPPTYEAALERWKREMGVGEEPPFRGSGPSLPGSGASLPGSGPGAATGATATPEELTPLESLLRQPRPTGYQRVMKTPYWRIEDLGRERPMNARDLLFRLWQSELDLGKKVGSRFGQSQLDVGKKVGSRAIRRVQRAGRRIRNIPGFAEGVRNFGGGLAMVGEGGQEEYVELPGIGVVRAGGATLMNLPKGANVIPADQMLQMQRIRQLARQPDDPRQQLLEQQQRRADPDIEAKVREALMTAIASQMAINPGITPVLEPGQTDLWAHKRALTGIPAFPPAVEAK